MLLTYVTLLSALYENSPIATAICEGSGRYIDMNSAMCRLLGYRKAELLRKTFADVSHPEEVARNREMREQLLAGQVTSIQLEKRYLHKDGHCVWAMMAVWALPDESGTPKFTIGQMVSIDKEKHMEEQLALALARARDPHELAQPQQHLDQAWQTKREIDIGVGILLERLQLDRTQAFEVLRRLARSTNRKLVDVANDLIKRGELLAAAQKIALELQLAK